MNGFSKGIASLGIPLIAVVALITQPYVSWVTIGFLGLFEVMALDIIFVMSKKK